MKTPPNNAIALVMCLLGIAATMVVFLESRNDPGLRMAALVAATSAGASLISIASTLLTGKDVSNHIPPPPTVTVQGPSSTVTSSTGGTVTTVSPLAQPENPANQ